ncbi:MAG: bifunctional aldolase/short-chain dehydrogenase [Phycisphaerales bacterium]
MRSRWDEAQARELADDPLGLRVYSSRLLGADENLVMHGGGNTSVKVEETDFFGAPVDTLYIKGSGWDLGTIEKPGFAPLRLDPTTRLAELKSLSDVDMARQLRAFLLDPSAPSPSVEAILHAIIPSKFVDHTHADAIVTISNTPRGAGLIADLYPDCLALPYVMPGFTLARQVYEAISDINLGELKGIILLHHGVFTFADDARTAYETMIDLVDRGERFIEEQSAGRHPEVSTDVDPLELARIRRVVSRVRGRAQLAMLDRSGDAQGYAARPDIGTIATRGPITPDHVLRTKRTPVIIPETPGSEVSSVAQFADDYMEYFGEYASAEHTMLDPAPRAAVWERRGCIAFGSTAKECRIVTDIARHTRWAIQTGEALGGWRPLSPGEIFEVEYWSLEQAKLARAAVVAPAHTGKIAIVTGANSGIGRATCDALAADGAVVVGLDRAAEVVQTLGRTGMLGIECDVTNDEAVRSAIEMAVLAFGGLDIIVCNAGVFRTGERIEELSGETWDQALAVNLTATQRFMRAAIPFLKLGVDPSILIVGSRNVPAPGAGAAAYSVSKAGLTQLARVAALELAGDGIRVNVVHPDAVFDTGLWTDDALKRSAERYGMTVEQYKTKNLLRREITSREVGALISTLVGPTFAATTGAQIPIDGGDPRVI